MAKIDFFSLGGLDENYKQCYVLTINGDIYILNVGIFMPTTSKLGVKKILPDFSWLTNNKQSIKGIFILTPTYENFGGLDFLNHLIPNIPIYTNEIGSKIISSFFFNQTKNNQPLKFNFKILQPLRTERIGDCVLTPFLITNSLPRSLGMILSIGNESIVYVDNFVISSNTNQCFTNQILDITNELRNKKTILISNVGLINKNFGFTVPHNLVAEQFNNILFENSNNRILFAAYFNDMYKVLAMITCAAHHNRNICIYDNVMFNLFRHLLLTRMFPDKNLKLVTSAKLNTVENPVIIFSGNSETLFNKLEKVADSEDEIVKLQETDTFVWSNHTIPGLEKKEANLFDELYRNNIKNVISIDKKTLPMQPSNEDHKFLIKLVKPTYIIPVSGLQMNFLNYQKMAVQMNIPRQNILTLSNGEVVTFENAILNPKHKFIKLEQQFVNEQGFVDNAPISMFEREQMKENGVVLVSLLVDLEKKQILKYNYDMIGVTSLTEENKKIITPLNEEFNKQISNLIQVQLTNNKRINTKDLKNEIKKLIDKQYNKKFSKKPLILSTIIFSNKEVENESNDSN